MTPRTPNSNEFTMPRPFTVGFPPGALMQIFDPPSHTPVESTPSTPAVPSVYSQMSYYGSPYSPQYGPYGSSANPQDVNHGSNGFYGQMNAMNHPYQYSPLMNGHYNPGYALPPYAYSSVSVDASVGTNVPQTSGNNDTGS